MVAMSPQLGQGLLLPHPGCKEPTAHHLFADIAPSKVPEFLCSHISETRTSSNPTPSAFNARFSTVPFNNSSWPEGGLVGLGPVLFGCLPLLLKTGKG